MQNENNKKRFAGKGYYIALIACIAAVGISGYVFVQTARDSAMETSAAASISPAASAEVSAAPSASSSPAPSQAADSMEDSYESAMGQETAASNVQWPLSGQVLSSFSRDTLTYSETMADWRTHEGLDIAADPGAPVMAADDGTVTAVYDDDYLGTVVVVSHDADISTRYASLMADPDVQVGDVVSAGDVIGRVGNTALLETKEPSHLHFEVFQNGIPADPMDYRPSAS